MRRLNCECRKGARCTACIEKESPEVFRNDVEAWDVTCADGLTDLCECGPVTRAQGLCECR